MTLRLDPRLPIVWRTPHSLQIGVDPVIVVLDAVSDGDGRLVDALAVGVTRDGLAMLADRAGVAERRVDELLAAVAPALAVTRAAASDTTVRPAIAVVGAGLGAQRVAAVLHEAGHPVALHAPGTAATTRGRRPSLAVLVSTHVIDPLEHQRWLRVDVPHLPIVFGEAAVTIGPLVAVGATACLGCVEREHARRDPARAAIATQLWGRAAAAESASLATEAAVEALRMLRASIPAPHDDPAPVADPAPRDEPVASMSVRLDAANGVRATTEWWPDDGCGCRELNPSSAPAPRRGTGSAHARPAPTSTAAPTTARAPFALV